MGRLSNQKVVYFVSGGPAAHQCVEIIATLQAEGAEVEVQMAPGAEQWIPRAFIKQLLLGAASLVSTQPMLMVGALTVVQIDHELPEVDIAWVSAIASNIESAGVQQVIWLAGTAAASRFPVVERTGEWVVSDQSYSGLPRVDIDSVVAGLEKLSQPPLLAGKRVMVTAGPTLEDIDPVRFIGNRSSGKMGFAVAAAAWRAGAEVELIAGPVALPAPFGVNTTRVRSARDMLAAVESAVDQADIYISVAAVADYRPDLQVDQKIKKAGAGLDLHLVPNPDLLRIVAAAANPPFCVGFAAETQQIERYAQGKLVDKGLQMIAANQVGRDNGGFESDNNSLHLFWPGADQRLPSTSKRELAYQLIEVIARRYSMGSTG